MSDDRAVKALERRMNRPLALALATLVVSIGVFFAGFMLVVEPTSKVTFPPELAVTTPTAGQTRVAQVRIDLGAAGKTATSIEASLSKGGRQALVAPTSGDAGTAGLHRTSSSSTARAVTVTVTATPKSP